MNSIYFHLIGGASGDMLLCSLVELGCPLAHLKKEFKKIKPDFDIVTFKRSVGHVNATFLDYTGAINLSYQGIVSLIRRSKLSRFVKDNSLKAYTKLFLLEKKIHKVRSQDFKFHHLGETDAILEITGFFIALEYLKIRQLCVSSFPMDRPAPVTLGILKGKQIMPINVNYETVTPTGAILLSEAVQAEKEFTPIKQAYGFGNCSEHDYLVAYLFEEETNQSILHEEIVKIEANIDDMNPQVFESLFDALYKEGAKETYVQAVFMKKSRPGFVLNVLCDRKKFTALRDIIFSHTTTFGVRYQKYSRDKLPATFIKKPTKFGPVTFRVSNSTFKKETPEYDECVAIARKRKMPLLQVYREMY